MTRPQRPLRLATGALLGVAMLAGCSSNDDPALPCASTTLENTVSASSWATQLAKIAKYHYKADLEQNVTTVDLLDAAGQTLDTLRVWQSFGDSKVPDGAMVAELGGLRLVTRGFDVDPRGYLVRAWLSGEGKPTLITSARFEGGLCYAKQVEGAAAPPCAGDLPIDGAPFTLPSCGIVNDLYALGDYPATLARLDYAVPAAEAKGTPAEGGFARTQTDGDLHALSVRASTGVASEETVSKWVAGTGLDAVLGSDAEVRLTTAFLDRAWWREVEQHVGFCGLTDNEPTGSTTQGLGSSGIGVTKQAMGGQCAGDQSAADWDAGDGGTTSEKANVWGDPHLVTHDGHLYDMQAAGEFVLTESTAGEPLKVHARFEPFANPKPTIPICAHVTFATAVATELDGHKVSIHARPSALYVDDKEIKTLADLPELDKGELTIDNKGVTIVWPGGERMLVARGNFLTISTTLPVSRRGQMTGLLGNYNGDGSDDYRLRSGEPLATPLSFETQYTTYADSWRLLATESLLHYGSGETTETFTNFAIPGRRATLADVPADARKEAEARCGEENISDPRVLSGCILDVVCAKEGDIAELAKASGDALPSSSGVLPGDDALAAGGDALSVAALDNAEGQKPADPTDRCQAPARRWLLAFPEKAAHTLVTDLDVDITGPGGWQDPAALPGGSVAKDSAVDSFLVHRNPDSADARPLEGWL